MNPPSPAIVAQSAVRRLPRWIVWLLCAAYVLAGFVGRAPWRDVDIAAFGVMRELATGHTDWFTPTLEGLSPTAPGLLQYWMGAWALQLMPVSVPADFAVRIPFMGLLALALVAMWWAVNGLARMPGAQPVAFAFGGEALPQDYARALADGGLLALLACLGLAQMSHETSHTLVQFCAVCCMFFAASNMWWRPRTAAVAAFGSPLALALAGAPAVALALGLAILVMVLSVRSPRLLQRFSWTAWWLLSISVAVGAAWACGLWQWRLTDPWTQGRAWESLGRLLMWFSWPTWPLAVWTLWRWRQQLAHPWRQLHLLIPLWVWGVALFVTTFTMEGDRALLLGLPGIAALAAFALPTLRRSLGALIDWLTLIFFTVSALTIWVVWISVQTGFPAKPAANVARLAQGFIPTFSLFPFVVATLATLAWLLLVIWRTRRHRAAIWKSLAVPAGGTTLGWVLLMTLWLPMLNYARSYEPHVYRVMQQVGSHTTCVQTLGLSQAQLSALRFYTPWRIQRDVLKPQASCDRMLATAQAWASVKKHPLAEHWHLIASVPRPTDRRDHWLVFQYQP